MILYNWLVLYTLINQALTIKSIEEDGYSIKVYECVLYRVIRNHFTLLLTDVVLLQCGALANN